MAIQKKKKEKEEFDASLMGWSIPGMRPTVHYQVDWDMILYWAHTLEFGLTTSREQRLWRDQKEAEQKAWATDYAATHMTPWEAYYHYTGFPALFAGGIGFSLIYNLLAQPVQVKTGTGFFSAAKWGMGRALFLEITIGTLIWAAVMVVIDPEHKVEGWGLDETRIYQETIEEPNVKWWKNVPGGWKPGLGTVV